MLLHRLVSRSFCTAVKGAKRKELLDRIIRVDHAGEFGADRIYAGQHAVLKRSSVGPMIQEMWDQEKKHRKAFETLMIQHRVRPTILLPFWDIAGFTLDSSKSTTNTGCLLVFGNSKVKTSRCKGAVTAALGKESAMACTVAVEEVIGQHYNSQLRELMEDDPEIHKDLLQTIKTFRDEELEHLNTGMEHDAQKAPFYSALTQAIKVGCKGAIWISKRI